MVAEGEGRHRKEMKAKTPPIILTNDKIKSRILLKYARVREIQCDLSILEQLI